MFSLTVLQEPHAANAAPATPAGPNWHMGLSMTALNWLAPLSPITTLDGFDTAVIETTGHSLEGILPFLTLFFFGIALEALFRDRTKLPRRAA